MINEKEIQTRIAEILKKNGFNVVASEVDEGFSKPAVFINVYPSSVTLLNIDMEQVTDTIEIKYIPRTETTEHCADIAQRLRNIFMYRPFDIKDRHLTIQSIEFDIEKYILYTYFNLEYMQETPNNEEYEQIQNLQIGGLM